MSHNKFKYEQELNEFYGIEEEGTVLSQHSVNKESYKELFTKIFSSLTDEEKERLKKDKGSEWTHIENHFRKLTEDGE